MLFYLSNNKILLILRFKKIINAQKEIRNVSEYTRNTIIYNIFLMMLDNMTFIEYTTKITQTTVK